MEWLKRLKIQSKYGERTRKLCSNFEHENWFYVWKQFHVCFLLVSFVRFLQVFFVTFYRKCCSGFFLFFIVQKYNNDCNYCNKIPIEDLDYLIFWGDKAPCNVQQVVDLYLRFKGNPVGRANHYAYNVNKELYQYLDGTIYICKFSLISIFCSSCSIWDISQTKNQSHWHHSK